MGSNPLPSGGCADRGDCRPTGLQRVEYESSGRGPSSSSPSSKFQLNPLAAGYARRQVREAPAAATNHFFQLSTYKCLFSRSPQPFHSAPKRQQIVSPLPPRSQVLTFLLKVFSASSSVSLRLCGEKLASFRRNRPSPRPAPLKTQKRTCFSYRLVPFANS